MWIHLLIVNALVGLALFEFAWAATKRHRTIDEARDSRFPAWRRNDVKNWSRLRLYPGALTFMPLKVFSFVLTNVFVAIANKVILIGVDLDKPVPIRQRKLTKIVFYLGGWFMSLTTFCFPVRKTVNLDYTYWLG